MSGCGKSETDLPTTLARILHSNQRGRALIRSVGLVMTVDFRTVVLSKGNEVPRAESAESRRSAVVFVVTVVFGVISALSLVAWIFG